ncbi:MAG: hypothetical protein MHM6MM_005232 [Cercozoa sp. M6MM]
MLSTKRGANLISRSEGVPDELEQQFDESEEQLEDTKSSHLARKRVRERKRRKVMSETIEGIADWLQLPRSARARGHAEVVTLALRELRRLRDDYTVTLLDKLDLDQVKTYVLRFQKLRLRLRQESTIAKARP